MQPVTKQALLLVASECKNWTVMQWHAHWLIRNARKLQRAARGYGHHRNALLKMLAEKNT